MLQSVSAKFIQLLSFFSKRNLVEDLTGSFVNPASLIDITDSSD